MQTRPILQHLGGQGHGHGAQHGEQLATNTHGAPGTQQQLAATHGTQHGPQAGTQHGAQHGEQHGPQGGEQHDFGILVFEWLFELFRSKNTLNFEKVAERM